MLSQANILPTTPMGANLIGGGATFRAWAPRATAVYVNGTFGGTPMTGQTNALLMAKDANGYWTGFIPNARDGDLYHFWVVGASPVSGYKRDPYAREMATDNPFPTCSCVIRSGTAYPWHDSAFVTPDFSNMIIYQLHVGTYAPSSPGAASTFLDVIGKIEYLAALGINVLQPLPIDEMETDPPWATTARTIFLQTFPTLYPGLLCPGTWPPSIACWQRRAFHRWRSATSLPARRN